MKRPTVRCGPTTSMAHQTAIPSRPRADLRLARGGGRHVVKPRPARGHGAPSSEFLPRSRVSGPSNGSLPRSTPQAGLCIARGFPLTHVTSPALPTGALNVLTHHGCLGQRANPRHNDSLTPPGNPTPAPCEQPATVRPSSALCG
jgi:hypothetical protein